MSVDAILDAIRALSPEERAEFSVRWKHEEEEEPLPELSPELARLLDERNAEYEANPDQLRTWDEVVANAKRPK